MITGEGAEAGGSAIGNLVFANVTSSTDPATAPSSANSRLRQPDTYQDSAQPGVHDDRTNRNGRGLCLTRPPLHSCLRVNPICDPSGIGLSGPLVQPTASW